MRYSIFLTAVMLGLVFSSCGDGSSTTSPAANSVATEPTTQPANDQQEIQTLVRRFLVWANSDRVIDLLPIRADSKDSLVIGFDLTKHQSNLQKLQATGFFDVEFIEDYNKVILTLDKNFKAGKYANWLVGELPPFGFAGAVNPWTLNQDVPYDSPNPWEQVEVAVIKTDGRIAEVEWRWGKLPTNADTGWKEFTYKFRVIKYGGKWKIAHLQGFAL